jgi:hypothetical protein
MLHFTSVVVLSTPKVLKEGGGGRREGGRQAVFGAGRTCLRNRVISGIVFQVISLLKKGEVTEKERSEARKPAGMARNVAKFVYVCVCGVCVLCVAAIQNACRSPLQSQASMDHCGI